MAQYYAGLGRRGAILPRLDGRRRVPTAKGVHHMGEGILKWRPRPELNRGKRFCRPLRNHSATWPRGHAYNSTGPGAATRARRFAGPPARATPGAGRDILPFGRPCRTSGAFAPHLVGDPDI